MKIAFMLKFRGYKKFEVNPIIDDFLVNTLGSIMNDSFMIAIAYFRI